jgi:polyisoprenoid-binding protein YceI
MKKTLLALLLVSSPAFAAEYEIDPSHTSAQFSVRHLMVSNVKGVITKATGKVVWDPKNPAASSVEATLDPNTIDTREAKRDEHLKSPEFLDIAKFPVLTFKSTKVTSPAAGKLHVVGNLSIHGISKEIALDVEGPTAEIKDPWGNTKVGASATAKINRKEFGLTWNKVLEAGGVAVGDEVSITLDVELVKKS